MQKYKNIQKYAKLTLGTSINFCSVPPGPTQGLLDAFPAASWPPKPLQDPK